MPRAAASLVPPRPLLCHCDCATHAGTSVPPTHLQIGVIVLWVHDVSDIPLDLLKIFNYCQLEGPKGLFLVELDYIATLASWAYYRFFVYFGLIFRGIVVASREVGFAPVHMIAIDECAPRAAWCMAPYDKAHGMYNRGHVKGATLGDGSFDVAKSFEVMGWGSHECTPAFWEATTLLGALQLMHVVWYCLLINVIIKKLFSADTFHDGARDVYEGESDDEGEGSVKAKAE